MLVLGIGGFMHDYNCCLIDVGGKRVAMAEAERLSRRKHHVIRDGENIMAPVAKCCADLNVKPKHIDVVVFGHTDEFACKEWLCRELPKARTVAVDHHLCHAAGAFFASGLDQALIVSVDGFGDGSSALTAIGEGNRIEELHRVGEDDSIGLDFLRATYHLGLGGYGSEGKTQGLAPYGEPTFFDAYRRQFEVTAAGGVHLGKALMGPSSGLAVEGGYLNTQLLTNDFLETVCPRRIAPEPLTDIHMNLAASVQKVLEDVVGEMCRIGHERTGLSNLVLSGGVTMNSSLNGALLRSGLFSRIFALPMASDRGIGLGAALHYVHTVLGEARFFELDHVFQGGDVSDKSAVKAMKKGGLKWYPSDDVYGEAAQMLSEGRIVGWVQGRSEMGARALGHRSILADPRIAEMKDTINDRVKHREWFRPFAPAVLADRAAEYFDFPDSVADLSFMTFTVPTIPAKADSIAATVHVDGTARVQTVDAGTNPEFARLIEHFDQITGVPVLLNTSFNDQGEPIVETAEDAVHTFLNSDMDVLCVGNVVGTSK
jgi:carbamoyltransferase